MAVPKRKTPRSKTRMRRASNWRLAAPARSLCPNCGAVEAAAHRLRQLRLVPRPPGARRRLSSGRSGAVTMRIAVDAMGGDRAPGEIVAGALRRGRRARRRGPARRASRTPCAPSCPAARRPTASRSCARSRSSRWTTSPARRCARRRTRRSCARAEAVRDGRADAMVGAGQHRRDDGRRAAAHRPHPRRRPARDRGADPGARSRARSSSSTAARPSTARPSGWSSSRVMGREYAQVRLGVDEPTVGLLSNGEEPGKGDDAAQAGLRRCSPAIPGFVGNVEGRDLMHRPARRHRHRRLHRQRRAEDASKARCAARRRSCSAVLDSTPEAERGRRSVVMPTLLEARRRPATPTTTGGAVLLGVDGRVRDLARLVVARARS